MTLLIFKLQWYFSKEKQIVHIWPVFPKKTEIQPFSHILVFFSVSYKDNLSQKNFRSVTFVMVDIFQIQPNLAQTLVR